MDRHRHSKNKHYLHSIHTGDTHIVYGRVSGNDNLAKHLTTLLTSNVPLVRPIGNNPTFCNAFNQITTDGITVNDALISGVPFQIVNGLYILLTEPISSSVPTDVLPRLQSIATAIDNGVTPDIYGPEILKTLRYIKTNYCTDISV